MTSILTQLRAELDSLGNEAWQANAQRYFKEEIRTRGIKTPAVRKLAAQYRKEMKEVPKKEVFRLCEDLWKSGYLEESMVACDWSHSQRKKFEPTDFKAFERWISKYVGNWASCDTFCNHTVGDFLMMYPEFLPELKRWAVSKNRWMKRAAAVSLILPARKGFWLKETLEIALLQLHDEDDMVQKGYGWMLKSASESHPEPIFKFVMQHKRSMPRTALRYAIEKMPADMKARAMEK